MPTDRQQYWLNAAEAARDEALLAQTHQPEPNGPPAKKLAPIFKQQATKKSMEASNDQPLGPPSRRPRERNAPEDRLGIRQRCQRQDIADSSIDAILRQGRSNSAYNLKYNGNLVKGSGHQLLPQVCTRYS